MQVAFVINTVYQWRTKHIFIKKRSNCYCHIGNTRSNGRKKFWLCRFTKTTTGL